MPPHPERCRRNYDTAPVWRRPSENAAERLLSTSVSRRLAVQMVAAVPRVVPDMELLVQLDQESFEDYTERFHRFRRLMGWNTIEGDHE